MLHMVKKKKATLLVILNVLLWGKSANHYITKCYKHIKTSKTMKYWTQKSLFCHSIHILAICLFAGHMMCVWREGGT